MIGKARQVKQSAFVASKALDLSSATVKGGDIFDLFFSGRGQSVEKHRQDII